MLPRRIMPRPPAASATNRIRLIEMLIWPNISRKVTKLPMPQMAISRLFHIRRSELRISIASMVMTANSGRQCCS